MSVVGEKQRSKCGGSVTSFLERRGYRLGKQIGSGSYSKVRLAYKALELGYAKVACKVIVKRKASPEFVQKFLPREISIIRTIRHPNIVSFFHIFELEDQVYMFMEYCDRGDLIDFLLKNGALQEGKAKHLFRQLVSAVEYLHDRDLAHRDLKCENILLTSRDELKITDFGFARPCSDPRTKRRVLSDTFCGSAAYAAPEILHGVNYNPKMTDVWSLGCVLYVMLCALMPFNDEDVREMLKVQMSRSVHFPLKASVSSKARRFIMHMLEPDVTRRATIKQIARGSWLNERSRYPSKAVEGQQARTGLSSSHRSSTAGPPVLTAH